MDRNYTSYAQWKSYLSPLGVKHARLDVFLSPLLLNSLIYLISFFSLFFLSFLMFNVKREDGEDVSRRQGCTTGRGWTRSSSTWSSINQSNLGSKYI